MRIAIDPTEVAWASGLFEGEGCFLKSGYSLAATLSTTDRDTLDRFLRVVGVGSIVGPYTPSTNRGNSRQYWRWQVYGFEKFQYVAALLWNGLGERRKAKLCELL